MKRIDKILPQSGRVLLSGEQVGSDLTLAFAESSAADTQKTAIVTVPTEQDDGRESVQAYKLAICNPSTVTALTVKLMTVEPDFGGVDRDCLVDTLAVPKAQAIKGTTVDAYEFIVGGIFCGGNLKIVVSNDTELGAEDAFAASLRLREF